MASALTNAEVDSDPRQNAFEPGLWPWYLALAALTLLFFLSFFNRFAGLRSGTGEFTTGIWFLQGRIPYRDYFSATPPLNTLKSALLLHLFGPFLIVSRAAGVVERVLIAWALFHWLSRIFARPFAYTGALITIILSSGDRTDPIASYNHDAIFLGMLSGLAASYALDRTVRPRAFLLWSILSGIFAALCMATKQTIGLGAMVAVPIAVAILLVNAGSRRQAAHWIAGFAAGCAAPLALLAAWMHRRHILMDFLTMAFLKGPAAKGGHATDFLRREIMIAGENWLFVAVALIGMACAARALLRSQASRARVGDAPNGNGDVRALRRISLAFGVTMLAAELLALSPVGVLYNVSKTAVYFVFLLVAVQVVIYAALSVRVVLTPRQRQFALLAAVSFFIAFFLSLSFPAFEAMTLPGLGLLVAAILDGVAASSRRWVYTCLGVLVFLQVREKLALPFGFEGLNEPPVRLATQPSRLPALRGMRLSPQVNAFLEGTVATIETRSTADDTIFVYPEISLFYALTGRGYPTLAASHNVDVVNDALAGEEAERILTRRPAVVVSMRLTPDEIRREDEHWRFGKPSGQHRLREAMEQLTAGYRLEKTYSVGQPERPICVYVRP
jgi:hypothetical protein